MQAETLTAIDPEIRNFIESRKPIWQEQARDQETFQKTFSGLLEMDPDQVLDLYLQECLDEWVSSRLTILSNENLIKNNSVVRKSHNTPTEPEEVSLEIVRKYISKRYPRYREYAEFHSGLAKMDQEGGDVLNESLLSTLLMPEEKLIGLYMKKKKDQNLTELDFYILRTIKLSCHSATSPYQWRYHHRKFKKDGNIETSRLNGSSGFDDDDFQEFEPEIIAEIPEDTEFNEDEFTDSESDHEIEDREELICARFQVVRNILDQLPISEKERDVFRFKFFLQETWKSWKGRDNIRHLQGIYKMIREMIITEIANKKEDNTLNTIHQLFLQAKKLTVQINEPEFLILRKTLSEDKQEISNQIEQVQLTKTTDSMATEEEKNLLDKLKIVSSFEKRLLYIFQEQLEAFSINHKF